MAAIEEKINSKNLSYERRKEERLKKVDEDCDGLTSKKATTRHESPPGDQAQFDWTEYEVCVGGIFQTVYCFFMILAASRKKAVCFSLREDAEAIYEAIQELFEDLGGVTLEMLIDKSTLCYRISR